MAVEVVMPKLGMAMKEGSVSIWNKKVGDPIKKGEPIASINSEKIETELEAPADGTLIEIVVQEDEGVPPGTVIGYIGAADEQVKAPSQPKQEGGRSNPSKDEIAATTVMNNPEERKIVKNTSSVKASPIAKKMAEKAGIKLELIKGTGPQGRITKEDVEQAIVSGTSTDSEQNTKEMVFNGTAAQGSGTEKVDSKPVTGMRKVIAMRMQESLLQSAQLTINMKADVTKLIQLQDEIRQVTKEEQPKLSLTDFIARASVIALQKHPKLNSAYINDSIETYEHIHLGIAVALSNGLVVPVIRHAENMSLVGLSSAIKNVAQKARSNELIGDEMKGSTFTITNLGAYGVEHFTPILNTPEAGILGVGAATDVPVFIGDEVQKRSFIPLSLTFDHRVLDGAPAAEFLRTMKRLLEEPLRILL